MLQNVGSIPLLYIKLSSPWNIITPRKTHYPITSTEHNSLSLSLSLPPSQNYKTHKREKMNIMKGKFLKAWMKKWRRMGRRVIPCAACETCCVWSLWHEEKIVPSDVPKGHLVVYVGEYHKRFVIKVTLLKHPLFQALLDQAQEVYDFNADSRLRIPCDENIFLSVVQCAKPPPDPRLPICLWHSTCNSYPIISFIALF